MLTDRRLPGMDGVELVRQVKAEHPDLAVVVMTAYGTIESAVEAMRLGAEDYLVKPFEAAELLLVIRRAIEFQELQVGEPPDHPAQPGALHLQQHRGPERGHAGGVRAAALGGGPRHHRAHPRRDRGGQGAARPLDPLLGRRRERPFVAVNCAAIPAELFESELFGFRRGAFTGATEHRRGHFQMANGGTLLLDEIGEMPLHLQSKLLRAIEEKKVTSVGADRAVDVDVRFIATTNKDLQAEVERGTFRRDLFYRLSVMPVRVPALRERPEDIPLLAEHFLEQASRRSKKSVRAIAPESLQALVRYPWPGNVRELENVIERAVIVANGDILADVERFLAPDAAPTRRWTCRCRSATPRRGWWRSSSAPTSAGLLERARRQAHRGRQARRHGPQELLRQDARYGLRRNGPSDPGDGGPRVHLKSGDRWFSYSRGATTAHRDRLP